MHGRQRGEHRVLGAVAQVERGRERLAAYQPPARQTGFCGREGLGIDRPLVAQEISDALMHLGVEPARQALGEPEHGERSVRIARHAEHEKLAVRAGGGEIGDREGEVRDDVTFVGAQRFERVESEDAGDVVGSEHGAADRGARLVDGHDGHPAVSPRCGTSIGAGR